MPEPDPDPTNGKPVEQERRVTHGRLDTLARLRGDIKHLDAPQSAGAAGRVLLGHAEADAALRGGLLRGALHEVFADNGRHAAAATGFVAGLSGRLVARRPLLWVRQDFSGFHGDGIRRSLDERLARPWPRSAQVVTV